MNEVELVRAYRGEPAAGRAIHVGKLTFRPCACGAWMGVDERDSTTVEVDVRAHYGRRQHTAWVRRGRRYG